MNNEKRKQLLHDYMLIEEIETLQSINKMRQNNSSTPFSTSDAIETAKRGGENFKKAMDSIDFGDILNA